MDERPLRIMIVDDEPDVLGGLRRVFHRERPRWQMMFLSSGQEALAELRRRPYDVVVSDLRMPDMDGAALLGAVRAEFPTTIRIVLSGVRGTCSSARGRSRIS